MKTLRLTLVLLTLLTLTLVAGTAYAAFSGVQGIVLASNGVDRWTYGGTVTISVQDTDDNTYETCTGTIDGAGNYSVTFDTTNCGGTWTGPAADFTVIAVQATFNAGPGGTPSDYNGTLFNLPASSGLANHTIRTDTSPTAISAATISAGPTPSGWMMLVAVAVLTAVSALFVMRRRQTVSVR